MNLHRFGVKIFAASCPVEIKEFVPVFHSWIQRKCVEGHQLIDVHDYSHIHHGPGILLVAHEGNFSTDMADGKLGLAYFRKLPARTSGDSVLRECLKTVTACAALLENEPALAGLRFRKDEFLVIVNDRLVAPNEVRSFQELKPVLAAAFGEGTQFEQVDPGSGERLSVLCRRGL